MQVCTCIRERVFWVTTRSTTDRIIDAAIQLMSEKGYSAATTKDIAELAGVNEVTLFRHFGNKRGLLTAISTRFSYNDALKNVFHNDITWNLERDLLAIAKAYHSYIQSIEQFVFIGFREGEAFPEINDEIAFIVQQFKQILIDYFSEMKEKKKIRELDLEATAMAFIATNFGFFVSRSRLGTRVSEKPIEQLLTTSISIFSRGLHP